MVEKQGMNKVLGQTLAWLATNCAFMRLAIQPRRPSPMDIVVSPINLGKAGYPRPVLIIEVERDSAIVAPLSTCWPNFRPENGDFMLDMGAVPGLNSECYIKSEHQRIPFSQMYNTMIGTLSGEPLQRFMKCCV